MKRVDPGDSYEWFLVIRKIYMNNPEIINPDDIQAFGDISRETLDSSDSVIYSQMSKV